MAITYEFGSETRIVNPGGPPTARDLAFVMLRPNLVLHVDAHSSPAAVVLGMKVYI